MSEDITNSEVVSSLEAVIEHFETGFEGLDGISQLVATSEANALEMMDASRSKTARKASRTAARQALAKIDKMLVAARAELLDYEIA